MTSEDHIARLESRVQALEDLLEIKDVYIDEYAISLADGTCAISNALLQAKKMNEEMAQEVKRLTRLLSDADADNRELSAAYVDKCGQIEVYKRKNELLAQEVKRLTRLFNGAVEDNRSLSDDFYDQFGYQMSTNKNAIT